MQQLSFSRKAAANCIGLTVAEQQSWQGWKTGSPGLGQEDEPEAFRQYQMCAEIYLCTYGPTYTVLDN